MTRVNRSLIVTQYKRITMGEQTLSSDDIDKLRDPSELPHFWELRRTFLLLHNGNFLQDRLICLSHVFVNVEYLNLTYPDTVMKKIRELGATIEKPVHKPIAEESGPNLQADYRIPRRENQSEYRRYQPQHYQQNNQCHQNNQYQHSNNYQNNYSNNRRQRGSYNHHPYNINNNTRCQQYRSLNNNLNDRHQGYNHSNANSTNRGRSNSVRSSRANFIRARRGGQDNSCHK